MEIKQQCSVRRRLKGLNTTKLLLLVVLLSFREDGKMVFNLTLYGYPRFQGSITMGVRGNQIFPFTTLIPFRPKSDQYQFSPYNINKWSEVKVMRTYKSITKGNMLWSFDKISQLILWENVRSTAWRICMWTLGLKGLVCVIKWWRVKLGNNFTRALSKF